jgi:hypothetical protein
MEGRFGSVDSVNAFAMMKIVHYMAYSLRFVFRVGGMARGGIGYFSINATTMVEAYKVNHCFNGTKVTFYY